MADVRRDQHPDLRNELSLNGTEFGLLTSTPILTGALFRLPLGIWTDRFGGRIVMLALLVASAVPVWFASYARELWQFLLLGLALGVVGASFAVGTPYVARFFAKEQRGFAMGVFGAGTTGAAINMFIAPALMARYGWRFVPKFYAVALLITALILWAPFCSRRFGAGQERGLTAAAIGSSQRYSGLEILPILFDRLWRLHRSVGLDAAVFCQGVWAQHRGGRAVGGLFLTPCRRVAGRRRLARRCYGADNVTWWVVGVLDQPVPSVLSSNRFYRAHHPWSRAVPHRFVDLALHLAAIYAWCRVCLRYGIDI